MLTPKDAPILTPTSVAGVVVAIPCFNEELAIASLVLRASRYADRVLVVDDGSSDETALLARQAGAEVIVHEQNGGKGKAVRTAFRYARDGGFEVLVLMDGDGQHDPAEIPMLVERVNPLTPQHVDVALGFRFGASTQMPAWRRVGKRVLDYATAAGGAGVVTDSQCGYRAFGRQAIVAMADRITNDGFGVESEQLVIAREAGLSMSNVPISCKYEDLDGSTKGPIAHGYEVLSNIVDVMTMRRPLLTIGVPSIIILVVATALAIRTMQFYNTTRVFPIASALAATALALLGALGVMTSLILNLAARIERAIERNRDLR